MIPVEAVEAAAKAAGLVFNEPANARDIEYIRTILEAAAPYMLNTINLPELPAKD